MASERTLAESGVRENYCVTAIGIKRQNEDCRHAAPETRVTPGDRLAVPGPTKKVKQFAGQVKGR